MGLGYESGMGDVDNIPRCTVGSGCCILGCLPWLGGQGEAIGNAALVGDAAVEECAAVF